MTYWQKVFAWIGALASLIALITAVWSVAISVNEMTIAMKTVQKGVEQNRVILEKRTMMLENFEIALNSTTRELNDVKKGMLTMVYANKDHLVVRSYDGTDYKIITKGDQK